MTSLLIALFASAHAAPIEISWQARLLDDIGNPVEGTHDVTVTLYDAVEDPSTAVWSDVFPVDVDAGFVSVILGSGAEPLDPADITGGDRWVGFSVDGEALSGRQRLTRVPAAVMADSVPQVASPQDSDCAGQAGRLAWDTAAERLTVCDGTTWRSVALSTEITLVNGARQFANGSFARSCKDYLNPAGTGIYTGDTGDGRYRIDPDGDGSNPITVECDMTNGGWIRLANISTGTPILNGASYTNGLNAIGSSDYIVPCGSLEALDTRPVMRVRMGNTTDYYQPVAGQTLCSMLGSHQAHQWSQQADGPFVVTPYYTNHLGGSENNWPANNVAGDSRNYTAFWGGVGSAGGCCATEYSGTPGEWGLAFDVYIRGQ